MLNYLEQLNQIPQLDNFDKNLSQFFLKLYQSLNAISEIDEITLILQFCSLNIQEETLFYLSDDIKIKNQSYYRYFSETLKKYILKPVQNQNQSSIDFQKNILGIHNALDFFDYFKEFEPACNVLMSYKKHTEIQSQMNIMSVNTIGIEDLPIKLTYDNVLTQAEKILDVFCPHLRNLVEKIQLEKTLSQPLSIETKEKIIKV